MSRGGRPSRPSALPRRSAPREADRARDKEGSSGPAPRKTAKPRHQSVIKIALSENEGDRAALGAFSGLVFVDGLTMGPVHSPAFRSALAGCWALVEAALNQMDPGSPLDAEEKEGNV